MFASPPAAFAEWRERLRGELEATGTRNLRLPARFLDLARRVACHAEPARWELLSAAVRRLAYGEAHLLELAHDPLVRRLEQLDAAVRREIHKTHAFVRFERARDPDGEPRYVAWFEPEHAILELAAPFFVRRFANMRWSILTPAACAHWDGRSLDFTAGLAKPPGGRGTDPLATAWSTYYASIFNPARVKVAAMRREMPVYYSRNLPETRSIPRLLADAPARVERMLERSRAMVAEAETTSAPLIDAAPLADLRVAVTPAACRRCPHAAAATQAVAGEGPRPAAIMLVGEQPGDQEDLAGRPFVGPAGEVLDRALAPAGLDRSQLFVTNAVKHFYWELRGKRRLHKKPEQAMLAACHDHLLRELAEVQPRVIVALGSTALTALTRNTPLARAGRKPERGVPERLPGGRWLIATWHPAYVLRAEPARAAESIAELAAHLSAAARLAQTREH